jgi:hypothetical protein
MRTSEGGLSRAKRDNVALATTRRASIEDARHPLSPTTFEKPAFKAGFFSSVVNEDENLRRRFEPMTAFRNPRVNLEVTSTSDQAISAPDFKKSLTYSFHSMSVCHLLMPEKQARSVTIIICTNSVHMRYFGVFCRCRSKQVP